MSGEQTLFITYHHGDDRAVELSVHGLVQHKRAPKECTDCPTGGLFGALRLSCIFLFTCSEYDFLVSFGLATRPASVLKDRLNMSQLTGEVTDYIVLLRTNEVEQEE